MGKDALNVIHYKIALFVGEVVITDKKMFQTQVILHVAIAMVLDDIIFCAINVMEPVKLGRLDLFIKKKSELE